MYCSLQYSCLSLVRGVQPNKTGRIAVSAVIRRHFSALFDIFSGRGKLASETGEKRILDSANASGVKS